MGLILMWEQNIRTLVASKSIKPIYVSELCLCLCDDQVYVFGGLRYTYEI